MTEVKLSSIKPILSKAKILAFILGIIINSSAVSAQGIFPLEPTPGYGIAVICTDLVKCKETYASIPNNEIRYVLENSTLAKMLELSFDNHTLTKVEIFHSYVVSDLSRYSPLQIASYISKKNSAGIQPQNIPLVEFRQDVSDILQSSGLIILYKEDCPACAAMKPSIKVLCDKNKVTLWDIGHAQSNLKCDRSKAADLYRVYNFRYSPTSIYIIDGKIIWTWIGFNKNIAQIIDLFSITK